MNILVIGSGMYVTGRNNSGTGTILSSLIETSKTISMNITVVSKSESSRKEVDEAAARINKILLTNTPVIFNALGTNTENTISELHSINEFDIAIISVPDHLHFDLASIVIRLGIHCLVVKPLTATLEESEKLVALQHKHKVYGAVEYHKRWDETNLYIKRAISEKKLGKLVYFTVDYSQQIDIPMKTFSSWAHKTNIFQYLGVHYVDLFYFLTGFVPEKLMAYGVYGLLKEKGIQTFDSVHTNIVWKNPSCETETFYSVHNTNWIDPNITSALSDQKYKVIGTAGRIECDQKNRGIEQVTDTLGILQVNPYFSDYLPNEDGKLVFNGYGHKSIRQFIIDVMDLKAKKTTLSHLEAHRPSFKDALVSMAAIDGANRSLAAGGSWITLKKI